MNTEPTINSRLAECLRQRHPEWRDDAIVSEQTGVLIDEPLKKPDVLIRSGAPVIVEVRDRAGRRRSTTTRSSA